MKLRYLSLLIFLFTLGTITAQSKDSLLLSESLSDKLWSLTKPQQKLVAPIANANPVLRWTTNHAQVSSISLNGAIMKQHSTQNYQEGDRYRYFGVDALSQVLLPHNTLVWGGASYENKRTEHVLFNDNTDIELIYPYVMADAKGGEVKSEQYAFNGGYLRKLNSNLILTAELDYRAVSAYRQLDPRPKNTVSDLNIKLGLGHHFKTNYLFGATINLQKYKQNSSVAFMSSTKREPIYHLSGLGERIPRFDGTFTSTRHDGYSYGLNIGLNQLQNNGWLVSIGYNNLQIKKIMASLNDLPLQKIKAYNYTFNLGYNSNNWSALLIGSIKERKGYENLYGSPTNGIYSIIATTQPYRHQVQHIGAKGVWKINLNHVIWYLTPEAGYIHEKEVYDDPYQSIDLNSGYLNLTSTLRISTAHYGAFTLNQKIGYQANLSKTFNLDIAADNPIKPLTDQMQRYLGKNKMTGHATIRWDLPFIVSSMQFFTEAIWNTQSIAQFKPMHSGVLKLGIMF